MRLVPLGDQAALAYFPDEAAALRFAAAVRRLDAPWLVDVVPAYSSVAVFFDLDRIAFASVAEQVQRIGSATVQADAVAEGKLHRIPCCYEFQLDLAHVAEHTGLSADEVIRLHTGTIYTVY